MQELVVHALFPLRTGIGTTIVSFAQGVKPHWLVAASLLMEMTLFVLSALNKNWCKCFTTSGWWRHNKIIDKILEKKRNVACSEKINSNVVNNNILIDYYKFTIYLKCTSFIICRNLNPFVNIYVSFAFTRILGNKVFI